jgi:hypothetical protein
VAASLGVMDANIYVFLELYGYLDCNTRFIALLRSLASSRMVFALVMEGIGKGSFRSLTFHQFLNYLEPRTRLIIQRNLDSVYGDGNKCEQVVEASRGNVSNPTRVDTAISATFRALSRSK